MSDDTAHQPERLTPSEKEALLLTSRALEQIRAAAWEMQNHINSIPVGLRAYVHRIENLADSLHNSPREVLMRAPHSDSMLEIEIKAGWAALASST